MKRTLVITGVCILGVLALALNAGVAFLLMMANTPATTLDLVAVPVAAKEIPFGTKLTADNSGDYFTFKHFPRDTVPPNAVTRLEELSGKRVTRRMSQGEVVLASEVKAGQLIDPPEGTAAMSVRIAPTQSAAGFALPGYKVVLLVTKKLEKKGKEVVFPVTYDALILATDPADTPGEVVLSVALTPEQTEVLEQAVDDGATIQIDLPQCGGLLARETDTQIIHWPPKSAEEVRAFLADE
jgi:pilus assembly protein CpaB